MQFPRDLLFAVTAIIRGHCYPTCHYGGKTISVYDQFATANNKPIAKISFNENGTLLIKHASLPSISLDLSDPTSEEKLVNILAGQSISGIKS